MREFAQSCKTDSLPLPEKVRCNRGDCHGGLDPTGGANMIAGLAIQHLSNKNGISHASRRAAAAPLS